MSDFTFKQVSISVELVDSMGDDLSVVNAARVSFDKESYYAPKDDEGREVGDELYNPTLNEKDKKLIGYLAKHGHWTPFGHCFASFRIKAPLFVARQLGKHQVGLVWNEVSRRYVDSEPEFYLPVHWRSRGENIKQGSAETPVELTKAGSEYSTPSWLIETCLEAYKGLLADGVCPEQARMVLPQNTMTEWIWSGSLAAFARVCQLRLDPHTQKETQGVAEKLHEAMSSIYPVSWSALVKESA